MSIFNLLFYIVRKNGFADEMMAIEPAGSVQIVEPAEINLQHPIALSTRIIKHGKDFCLHPPAYGYNMHLFNAHLEDDHI